MTHKSDEITSKNWGVTLGKEDFSVPIRQEYRKLGQTISTGTIKYEFPPDGGELAVAITGNDGEQYKYRL